MENANLAVVEQSEQPATQINNLHKELKEYAQSMVEKAIQVGGLLVEQKERIGHGHWLGWVEGNLIFSVRTVQHYINCYQHRDQLNTKSVSHLGKAIHLLASPKKPQLEAVPSRKTQGGDPGKAISEEQDEVSRETKKSKVGKTVVPPAPKEACCTLNLIEWQPVRHLQVSGWYGGLASNKVRGRCDELQSKFVSLHCEMIKFFRNDANARKEKLSREDWERLHEETKQFATWLFGVSQGMGKAAGIIEITEKDISNDN